MTGWERGLRSAEETGRGVDLPDGVTLVVPLLLDHDRVVRHICGRASASAPAGRGHTNRKLVSSSLWIGRAATEPPGP